MPNSYHYTKMMNSLLSISFVVRFASEFHLRKPASACLAWRLSWCFGVFFPNLEKGISLFHLRTVSRIRKDRMDFYHRLHRLLLDKHLNLQHKNGSKIHHGYPNEASFDTNMVIILASLLCALICALGLNSILRCALRCSRRFSSQSSAEQAAAPATGLKKSRLRQIPVAVYGAGVDIPATDCPICLGEFMDGEKVRVLPECRHGFHVRCIDMWLVSHSSCPTCRRSLTNQPAPSDEEDAEAAISSGAHADIPAGAADDAG